MATYSTRKQGTAARRQTIARNVARQVKAGAVRTTRNGHVRRTGNA